MRGTWAVFQVETLKEVTNVRSLTLTAFSKVLRTELLWIQMSCPRSAKFKIETSKEIRIKHRFCNNHTRWRQSRCHWQHPITWAKVHSRRTPSRWCRCHHQQRKGRSLSTNRIVGKASHSRWCLSQANQLPKVPLNKRTLFTRLIQDKCTRTVLQSLHSPPRQASHHLTHISRIRTPGSRCLTFAASSIATFSLWLMAMVSMDAKFRAIWNSVCLNSSKLKWGICSKSITSTSWRRRTTRT